MSGIFSKESIKNYVDLKTHSGNIFIDEYIHVPDSLSGIKEIMFLDVFPSLETSEILNSKLSVTGVLRYSIVYVTEEHFGSIKVLRGGINFSSIIDFDLELTPDMKCETWLSMDRADHSMVNTRKISLNALVKANTNFAQTDEKSYVSGVLDAEKTEVFNGEGEYFIHSGVKDEEFKVSHKMEIPFDKPEISEILSVNIVSYDNSYIMKGPDLGLRSSVKAKILYLSTKGKLCTEDVEFGNDEIDSIKLDNPSREHHVLLKTRLKDIVSEAMEDNDGERRIVKVEIKFLGVFNIYEKVKASYLKDFYHMENETKIKSVNMSLLKDINNIQKSFPIRGNFDGLGEFEEIFINGANVVFDHVVEDRNVLIVSGVVKMNSILITQEGHDTGGVKYFELPFSETISSEADLDLFVDELKIDLRAQDFMYSILSDNRIEVEVRMDLNINCFSKEEVKMIEEVEIGQPICEEQKDQTLIRLYYTCTDDTLWNICKKFRINRDELSLINEGVDFDKLETGKMLIIP